MSKILDFKDFVNESTFNKNSSCPNVHCEGGVITYDGQSGRLCKFCNPSVKPKNEDDIDKVAREFGRLLAKDLTPEQQAEVLALNKDEKDENTCHTHDFLDSNLYMADAIKNVTGEEPFLEKGKDGQTTGILEPENAKWVDLWNAAWHLARAYGFWWKTSK